MHAPAPTAARTGPPILIALLLSAILFGCEARAPKFVSGSPDVPEVSAAALAKMSKALGLTDAQRATASDLHAAYAQSHEAAARKYRDFTAQAERLLESTGREKRLIIRREEGTLTFARHTHALAERFLEDLRLTLTGDQSARWDDALRALRRARGIGAAYAERSADLREAVESIDGATVPPHGPDVLAALRAWEDAIDPVIIRKENFIRAVPQRELAAARASAETDTDDKPARVFGQWRLIIREERLITQRSAREIVALLPDAAAASLDRAVHERLYPWLFESSEAAGVLKRAAALDQLTPQARAEIAALQRDLASGERALAAEAARALDAWERTAAEDEIAGGHTPELNPDLARRYRDLEARTADRLAAILSDQQRRAINAEVILRDLPPLEFDSDPNG